MNGIKNYLMVMAVAKIRKASADIIKDGEIDPAMSATNAYRVG